MALRTFLNTQYYKTANKDVIFYDAFGSVVLAVFGVDEPASDVLSNNLSQTEKRIYPMNHLQKP